MNCNEHVESCDFDIKIYTFIDTYITYKSKVENITKDYFFLSLQDKIQKCTYICKCTNTIDKK